MANLNIEWEEILVIENNDYGDSFYDLKLFRLNQLSSYHNISGVRKALKIIKRKTNWSFIFGFCILKPKVVHAEFIESKWKFDRLTLEKIKLNKSNNVDFKNSSFSLSCIRGPNGISITQIIDAFFVKNIINLTSLSSYDIFHSFFHMLHKINYYVKSRYSFNYLSIDKVIDNEIKLHQINKKYQFVNELVASFNFERTEKTSYKRSGDHRTSHYISLVLPTNNYLKALLLKLYGNKTKYNQFDPDNIFLEKYEFLSEYSIRFHVIREDSDVDIPDKEFTDKIMKVKNDMLVNLHNEIDLHKYNISNLSTINFLVLLQKYGRFEL